MSRPPPPPPRRPVVKVCTVCQQEVPINAFNRDGRNYRSECRWCQGDKKRASMATDKGRVQKRARDRKRAARIRALWREAKAAEKAAKAEGRGS